MSMHPQATKQHHNAGKRWGRPFEPGHSGNPTRGPRSVDRRLVRAYAQALTHEALRVLRDIAEDETAPPLARTFAAHTLVEAGR